MADLTIEETAFDALAPLAEESSSNEVFIEEPESPCKWYAGYLDGKLVGCYGLMQFSTAKARLRGWYVCEEHRGEGYGGQLLDHFVETARQLKFPIAEANTKHEGILESRGFIEQKRFETGYVKYALPLQQ